MDISGSNPNLATPTPNESSSSSPSPSIKPQSQQNRQRYPPNACLFVASLSDATTEEILNQFFVDRYECKVIKSKIIKDNRGLASSYAFVQLSATEEADLVLNDDEDKLIDGKRIRIERARINRTLFVARLPRNLTSNELREIGSEFGEVEIVTLIKSYQSNTNKGCAFIKYLYREDAIESLMGLRNTRRNWIVEWATSKRDPDLLGSDKCNVFIGGIDPLNATKEWITERFGVYGEIDTISICNNHTSVTSDESANDNQSKDEIPGENVTKRSAYAFIRYLDSSSSVQAIEKENGEKLNDRYLKVQYCEADETKQAKRQQRQYRKNYQNYNGLLPFNPETSLVKVNSYPQANTEYKANNPYGHYPMYYSASTNNSWNPTYYHQRQYVQAPFQPGYKSPQEVSVGLHQNQSQSLSPNLSPIYPRYQRSYANNNNGYYHNQRSYQNYPDPNRSKDYSGHMGQSVHYQQHSQQQRWLEPKKMQFVTHPQQRHHQNDSSDATKRSKFAFSNPDLAATSHEKPAAMRQVDEAANQLSQLSISKND